MLPVRNKATKAGSTTWWVASMREPTRTAEKVDAPMSLIIDWIQGSLMYPFTRISRLN